MLSRQGSGAACVNTMNETTRCALSPNTPVCTQDPGHDGISDPVIDRLPVGTADEELVLRAEERKQMAAQHAARC